MYIIFTFIIFIIILELYFVIKNLFDEEIKDTKENLHVFNESIYTKGETNKSDFNTFYVKGDKNIEHKPGKIFINEDFNIFIHYKNKLRLMKKNIIYDIPDNFILEILDVNEKDIIYYYFEY